MEEEEKISQTHQKLYVLKTVKMTHMKMTKTIDQIIKSKFWLTQILLLTHGKKCRF